MSLSKNTLVETPLGTRPLDSTGAVVAAARMDPALAYRQCGPLLQQYVNAGSASAWQEIRQRVDNVYQAVRSTLDTLESETSFMAGVKSQLQAGKKLFFKPNLVALPTFNFSDHAPNLFGCCTPWEFQAAVMRWFHEAQGVSYYQMALGEGGAFTPSAVKEAQKAWGGQVTAQAVMEGRRGDKYGGWGFYFVRQYLAECRRPGDREDPLRGYEDSLKGHSTPTGTVSDRLLIYDLNAIADDMADGRDIAIADGINYSCITLHKAVVGGDPQNLQDRQLWPGSVLVDVPKVKIHVAELFTGCLKNLGIGLYPMTARNTGSANPCDWKYGSPKLAVPSYKMAVPHSRWEPEYDPETLEPLVGENGRPKYRRTGGIIASLSDTLRAIQQAGVQSIHIVDAIECTNINHSWMGSQSLPEGLVLAGLDPVAVDSAAARYLFTMAPMEETAALQAKYGLTSDVIQKTPLPELEGPNIVTRQGYDSSFSRYGGLEHCEKRGLGQRLYHISGEDLWQKGRLASVEQRLGRVENGRFNQILTTHFYHTPAKYHVDLQAMSFAYLKANDALTGSRYLQDLLEAVDDDKNGIIDYVETGKGSPVAVMSYGSGLLYHEMDPAARLKLNFLLSTSYTRLARKEWNPRGLAIGSHSFITRGIGLAFAMAQAPKVHEHPMQPGRSYGGGMWPSLQYAIHKLEFAGLYGQSYPDRIDLMMSPFGLAFQYADLKFNRTGYVTPPALAANEDVIGRYKTEVKEGAAKLPFTLYVPSGMGRDWNGFLLNVEETDSKEKMFTASFGNGEVWDKLHLSEFGL